MILFLSLPFLDSPSFIYLVFNYAKLLISSYLFFLSRSVFSFVILRQHLETSFLFFHFCHIQPLICSSPFSFYLFLFSTFPGFFFFQFSLYVPLVFYLSPLHFQFFL